MESNKKYDNNKTDAGYSEARLDKSNDLMAGQWLDLSAGKARRVQIAPTKSADSTNRLQKLVDYSHALIKEIEVKVIEYGEDATGGRDLSRSAKEIEKLQSKLHTILRSIQFEQKGDLDITKLPKEAQNLVK